MLIGVGFVVFWAMKNHERFQPGRPPMPVAGCGENLTQLANALRQYANDHGDILPSATEWCDQVRDYVPTMSVYTCPGGNSGQRSSFALNQAIAGRNQDSLDPTTVLLFESAAGWNASGTQEIAGSPRGLIHVALINGQVVRVGLDGLAALRWIP
jgi:hypothetical protein